ncbi:MAG: hypothetical protein RLY87_1983 [Chloroflexota bacterium]
MGGVVVSQPAKERFVSIPTTTFLMGTPVDDLSHLAQKYSGTRESYREESPQHHVTVDAYDIAQTPVTVGQYAAFISAGGDAPISWVSQRSGDTQAPVVNITLLMAQAYVEWRGTCDGQSYRLPTEAEWECAARGTDGRQFPWGNDWDVSRAASREAGVSLPTVGSYPAGASPWGLLDMAGTVWEWTTSIDALYPYVADDGRNDGTSEGRRVIRGGCYVNPIGYARCACRFRMQPHMTNAFLGFRIVRKPGS